MGRRERNIERKRRRNATIVGVILVFLMVFSVVGFAIQGPFGGGLGSGFEYNGFEFDIVSRDGIQLLVTEVDGREIGFYTDPDSAQNLYVEDNFNSVLRNADTIYLTRPTTSPGEDMIVYSILLRDYPNFSTKNVQRAYLQRDPLDPDPVRTCEDASEETPVIEIKYENNQTSSGFYEVSDYCYELHAIGFDVVVARDYLIYTDIGVIW